MGFFLEYYLLCDMHQSALETISSRSKTQKIVIPICQTQPNWGIQVMKINHIRPFDWKSVPWLNLRAHQPSIPSHTKLKPHFHSINTPNPTHPHNRKTPEWNHTKKTTKSHLRKYRTEKSFLLLKHRAKATTFMRTLMYPETQYK